MENQSLDSKFKDDAPENTIAIVKNILQGKLNIKLYDECTEPVSGCFSARVTLKDTIFGANGKGASKAFALASAYGELIERIQNQMFFKLQIDLSDHFDSSYGFAFSPDEQVVNVDEYKGRFPSFYGHLASLGVSYEAGDSIVVQPFYSVENRRTISVPIQPLDYVYGTNGMCAGNTIYEALVQGLSEIIERSVMFAVLDGGITLPRIPLSRVKKSGYARSIYESIMKAGKYEVQFKDASFISGLPTVGVILIDRRKHSYHVRWGVHPNMEIALERGLTEIFQQKSVETLEHYMRHYSYHSCDCSAQSNKYSAFRTGVACYPNSLFAQESSTRSKEPSFTDKQDNPSMLKFIINLIKQHGYDILIRDVSFLGFPSYRVIVPGMSEVVIPRETTKPDSRRSAYSLRRLLFQLDEFDNAAINDVLGELENSDIQLIQNASDYLRIPVDKLSSLSSIPIGLFIAMLYFKIHEYVKAYTTLDKMIQRIRSIGSDKDIDFHYCIRDLIGAIGDGLTFDHARRYLKQFYESGLLEYSIYFLRDSSRFFENFLGFKCWECSTCEESIRCHFFRVSELKRNIRRSYSENCPNQEDLITKLNV